MIVEIVDRTIDTAAETAALSRGRTDVGAVVVFSGICRDSEGDEKITALTLEHYPGMAEAEIARHVEEAETRWPLLGVIVGTPAVAHAYIDFGLGSASLLLGHAHPAVVEALMNVAPHGSHYGQPHEAELEWGERVLADGWADVARITVSPWTPRSPWSEVAGGSVRPSGFSP